MAPPPAGRPAEPVAHIVRAGFPFGGITWRKGGAGRMSLLWILLVIILIVLLLSLLGVV